MKKRLWDEGDGDDPAAGLINLFDVWIAFAAALLLSVVSYMHQPPPAAPGTQAQAKTELEAIQAEKTKMERYQESKASKSGEGERLGTAYRLKSGEIIYVRDGTAPEAPKK